MSTVLCLGEIVVDWIGTTYGADTFERHVAGVAANVAGGLARLGVDSAVIGRVGDDLLGRWSLSVLDQERVDTSGIVVDKASHTRMAFVARRADGERDSLAVTRVGCADARLSPEDLVKSQFAEAGALYFGSTSLSRASVARTTAGAIELARANDLLVVCDTNIWPAMWRSTKLCRRKTLESLKDVDLLKVSLSELEFLTGSRDPLCAERLRLEHALPVVIVTLGDRGAFITAQRGSAHVTPVPITVVERAGAGDGFVAAAIAALLPLLRSASGRRALLSNLSLDTLVAVVRRANAAGALVASRLGAFIAMPTTAELEQFLAQGDKTI